MSDLVYDIDSTNDGWWVVRVAGTTRARLIHYRRYAAAVTERDRLEERNGRIHDQIKVVKSGRTAGDVRRARRAK